MTQSLLMAPGLALLSLAVLSCEPSSEGDVNRSPSAPKVHTPASSRNSITLASEDSAATVQGASAANNAATSPVTIHLTWKNYSGTELPEQAVYVLNDVEIGAGTAGFRKVLEMLRSLPSGSTVEIITHFPPRTPSSPARGLPFADGAWDGTLYSQFRSVKNERNLQVTVDGRNYPLLSQEYLQGRAP